tara:strand:+ start:6435 stop:6698 length:264 start_codon:yes stop_codon:yes gene_type:complete
MVPINAMDLAELLECEGYAVDPDTGEVYTEPNGKRTLLVILAALNKLYVAHDAEFQLGFYIPHWKCYDMDGYCDLHPHEQQCKCYDV